MVDTTMSATLADVPLTAAATATAVVVAATTVSHTARDPPVLPHPPTQLPPPAAASLQPLAPPAQPADDDPLTPGEWVECSWRRAIGRERVQPARSEPQRSQKSVAHRRATHAPSATTGSIGRRSQPDRHHATSCRRAAAPAHCVSLDPTRALPQHVPSIRPHRLLRPPMEHWPRRRQPWSAREEKKNRAVESLGCTGLSKSVSWRFRIEKALTEAPQVGRFLTLP